MMLACMLAVLIMAVISTSYVPVWMKEKENEHMRSVGESFSALKSTIDTQISKNNSSTECVTPLTLGCEGIFLFAPDELGTLTAEPFEASVEVYNDSKILYSKSTGKIRFASQNRYFPDKNYIYECGGIIVDQSAGESMLASPALSVTNTTTGTKLKLTLISLIGTNTTVTSIGTVGISTKLRLYGTNTYTLSGENITINVTTKYLYAWLGYFNTTFKKSNVTLSPPPGTFNSLEEVGTQLEWIKSDIDSNTPAQIQASAASPIKDAIDEITGEVNDAIEARDKGEEDNLISAKQDAIVHCDDALNDINDYWSKGEITDSYRDQLVAWINEIKSWLQGGGLGIRNNGVAVTIPSVIELTINYAVIEVKF